MLRKLAVALIAATAFTAPVLAQTTAPANPPANAATKTDTAPATATTTTPATPKVVVAKPSLKSAKVKHGRRLAHRVKRVKHAKHVRHIKLVKHTKHVPHVKHVKTAKHLKTAKISKTSHGTTHVHHILRKSTTARSDAPSAPKSVN